MSIKKVNKSNWIGIVAAIAVGLYSTAMSANACPGAYCDDFNDDQTHSEFWAVEVEGTGPTVAEANGRVEFAVPASSTDGPNGLLAGRYASRCVLRGDFAVTVDYALIDWPETNGVRVTLVASDSAQWTVLNPGQAGVGRISFGPPADFPGFPRESYLMAMGTVILGVTPTTDSVGILRMERQGSLYTSHYHDGTGWVPIASASGPMSDVHVFFGAHSGQLEFTNQNVLVAFDDFVVESGGIVCDGGPTCGNGIVEVGEECDDGNVASNDGCDSSCWSEPCLEWTNLLGDCLDDLTLATTDLGDCRTDLLSCLDNPLGVDGDGDGEQDATDACPDTLPDEAVDDAGCSQSEFCAKVDVTVRENRRACRKSDWMNDEPAVGNPRDCQIDRNTVSGSADDTCVPYVE